MDNRTKSERQMKLPQKKLSDNSTHGNTILLPHKCAEIFKYLRFCCTLVRKYGFGIEDLFTAVYDESVKKELRDKLENNYEEAKLSDYSEYPTVAAHLILEYISELPGSMFSDQVLVHLRLKKNSKHEELLPHIKLCFKFMDEETFSLNKYMFSFFSDFVRSTSAIHMNLYRLHNLLVKAIFVEKNDESLEIVQKQIIILCIREYDALFKPSVIQRLWKRIASIIFCGKEH